MPSTHTPRTQLQGRITKFSAEHNVGVIRAESGRAFRFKGPDIVNRAALSVGAEVDFLVAAAARPVEIFVLDGSPYSAFAGSA